MDRAPDLHSPTGGQIRAVVFDIGGVLLDWDPRHLYRKLFEDGEAMERFLTEVCSLEWHAEHDRGKPIADGCAELVTSHPADAEMIWAWSQRTEEMVAGPIDGSVRILAELKGAGIPCYALSNMEAETFPRRLERFGFLRWFDGCVISAFEGVAKPDSRIFERLLERFALAPAQTLMIDDNAANIDVARAFGLHTVLFESPERLRGRLRAEGLLDG